MRWFVDGETSEDQAAMAREWARYHAVLAASVSAAFPGARFRMAELGGHNDAAQWSSATGWLYQALYYVLGQEDYLLALLGYVWPDVASVLSRHDWGARSALGTGALDYEDMLVALLGSEEAVLLLEAMADADFYWPDATVSRSDLVHEVGLHWYAFADVLPDARRPYQPDRAYLSTMSLLQNVVARARRELGVSLATSVSEIGFPAVPTPDLDQPFETLNTSPGMQAGMLVRLLLLARASGVDTVGWHTHMSGIAQGDDGDPDTTPTGWLTYSSEGLREDVTPNALPVEDFRARSHAFRRPSWFAYQRLARLLADADDVELVLRASGYYVVRLSSTRGFFGAQDFQNAYVMWGDQRAALPEYQVTFEATGVWQVSLVPEVVAPATASETDGGYAAGESVSWEPGRTSTAKVTASGGEVTVRLEPANHLDNPAPVCLLTDGELVESGTVGDFASRRSAFA